MKNDLNPFANQDVILKTIKETMRRENELSPIERVLTVYCEQYKLNNIIKFLKDINITNKLGQAYRFVIRYNQNDNDLYIYDPKVINKLLTKDNII